jgi:UDP-N-acetylmuramyl tripeptide synthase
MRLVDARRLTGPNHLSRSPLVIVEIDLDPAESVEEVRAVYLRELVRMREALGLGGAPSLLTRAHRGGAIFAYEAEIDTMLAHAEISEWAAESAADVFAGKGARSVETKRGDALALLARDRSPRLLALVDDARRRGVPLFWDDDAVSLGAGKNAASFARGALPDPSAVAWDGLGSIPTVLVTGTNGKTTSSRLLARVATEAGLVAGTTSSGGITVGAETVEDGDWTGPAAARIVLRRPEVELAVLETARGGILRRGLAVETCDVALITNVSDDHIGTGGIDDVAAMVEVKGVVARAVRPGGTTVLNARDPNLVALARGLDSEVTFFADLEAPACEVARAVIDAHRALGRRVVFARAGVVVIADGASEEHELVRIDALPITFGAAARYNVENVLGVVAASEALGLSRDALLRALRGFGMRDNPGRGQVLERDGVTVVLDFGHNPEGVRAVMQLVAALRQRTAPAGKLTVVAGSPGDRSDQEIVDVARVLHEARPDRVLVRELGDYLRGRSPGDVPALYRRALIELGMPEASFAVVGSEVEALARAFEGASPGDLIAVLVHLDHDEVRAFLAAPPHTHTTPRESSSRS